MQTLRGRVVVRESGAPLPDLLVVAYEIEAGAARNAKEGPEDEAPVQRGRRLGSALTGADGRFELRYAPRRRLFGASPAVALEVQAPEDEPFVTSHPLHRSHPLRPAAGAEEELLLRVRSARLLAAGAVPPGGAQEAAAAASADLLARMRALRAPARGAAGEPDDRPARPAPVPDRPRGEPAQRPRPPLGFDLRAPVHVHGRDVAPGAALAYDPETRGFRFREGAGAAPQPVAFGGVRWAEPDAALAAAGGAAFQLDPERRVVHLLVPRSSAALAAPETGPEAAAAAGGGAGPGPLYTWYRTRRPVVAPPAPEGEGGDD